MAAFADSPAVPDPAAVKQRVRAAVEMHHDRLLALSHAIHAEPELAFAEHASAGKVAAELTASGFAVEQGVCELPTALRACAGTGDLSVALLAEYDALPGIGHACGHNVIAAAAVGAALGLAGVADEIGMRVLLLGTPAEEGGGGKVLMLERGAFDDVAAALMVHPAPVDVHGMDFRTQAVSKFAVEYTGVAAHAAAAPQLGVNAADAAVIAQVAIGQLRQQLPVGTRIAAYVAVGGEATNVIPAHVRVEAEVRAYTVEEMQQLKARVLRCFEAGALATGCEWAHRDDQPVYAEMRPDQWLSDAFDANVSALGRVVTRFAGNGSSGGSSDMGNVTHELAGIQPGIALAGAVNMPHSIGFTAEAASPGADAAILDAAIALAWTAVDLATDPAQRARLLTAQAGRRR